MQPEVRYARSGDVSIAYQVVGDGPFDVVYVPGFVSNVDLVWRTARGPVLRHLASFSRLIIFDEDVPRTVDFWRRSRCDGQAVRTIAASLLEVRAASTA